VTGKASAASADAAVAAVDVDRIERDLRTIIAIPSITGSEEVVQSEIERLFGEAGLAVDRIDTDPATFATDPDWPGQEMPRTTLPVVVGRIGRPGGRRLLLVGHVDVVPPGDPATWSVDPWGGEVRDGQMYGRGACDMKGGVVSILAAMRALVASGAANDLAGEVLAVSVPSEEDGGQGMLAAIRAGCTGDAAVITEPTSLEIVVAHAGAITFRLTVPGRAAHASVRREGVSALDNLYTVLRALAADETARNASETNPLMTALGLPYATIVGKVSGGDWASTVLDQVVVEGRYGVKLGQGWRDAEADLRAAIESACAGDPFLRDHPVRIENIGGKFSSGQIAADHPLPESVAATAERVIGRRPARVGKPYGADMRLLVNEGGTPTIIFGPGHERHAHSADERVPLSEVADCARVLAAWVVGELGGGSRA
jgi:acetylornithine deacetylase